MFPLLSQMVERPPEAVGVIYVAPIKALLDNQADRLGSTPRVGLRRSSGMATPSITSDGRA